MEIERERLKNGGSTEPAATGIDYKRPKPGLDAIVVKNRKPGGGITKVIFLMFMVTAGVIFLIGGVQLAVPAIQKHSCTKIVTGTCIKVDEGIEYNYRRSGHSLYRYQDVTYSYSYGGKDYTATVHTNLEKFKAKEVGDESSFRINPKKPTLTRFVEDTSRNTGAMIAMSTGLAILFSGVSLMFGRMMKEWMGM